MFTTTHFEALTRTVASALGLSGARIVVVPHPLGGSEPEVVRAWADSVVEDTLAHLISP